MLHQAESYEQLGMEQTVQTALISLIQQRPNSPLIPEATYLLGQSYMRGKQWDRAARTFLRVQTAHPTTEFAIGSHYYLGQLADANDVSDPIQDQLQSANDYFFAYLTESPDGRFATAIATHPLKKTKTDDPDKALALGRARVAAELFDSRTHKLLTAATFKDAWLPLATNQFKRKKTDQALATLAKGIPLATTAEELQAGVDMLIRNTTRADATQRLQDLTANPLPAGGDYLLWKLAYLDSAHANRYYKAIVTDYPTGDYAPESQWQFMRPKLQRRDVDGFLADSVTFLEQYPYAQSAAKVLFWRGKLFQGMGQFNDATAAYEKILADYPTSYYAFRSQRLLDSINTNQKDRGWTVVAYQDYPLDYANPDFSLVSQLPHLPDDVKQAATELEAIGAQADMKRLIAAVLDPLPAVVQSWAEHQANNPFQGIRTIRDSLKDQARGGDLSGLQPNQQIRQLLYPLYYQGPIAKRAKANQINPVVAQSLMREESYFNPLAVSSSNALGLMQLLPSTAAEVAGWEKLRPFQSVMLFQPDINVQLGCRYLGHLHQLFTGYGPAIQPMLSVGAYNGGPNAMKGWVANSTDFQTDLDRFVEFIPYEQTRHYIEKVFASYWNYQRLFGVTP